MKNFLQGIILASKAFLISVVALVVLAAVGGAVYAHFSDFPRFACHHHMPHYVVEHLVDKMERELDLSGAQRREVEAALDDAVRRFRDARPGRIDDAAALINRPQLTVEEVRGAMQAREADGMRVEREALVAETMVRIHAALTPAQRGALAEWMQARADGGWFHRRGHRHGPHYDTWTWFLDGYGRHNRMH